MYPIRLMSLFYSYEYKTCCIYTNMYMVSYEKLAYYDYDRYYHSIVNDLILKN